MTVFSDVIQNAEMITEIDVDDWVVPSILDFYDKKLNSLAYRVYGDSSTGVPDVAVKAFKESAREELRSAICTFLFTKEHWRTGRDLDPYLRLCLNRLAQRRTWEINSIKIKHAPVCPLCRENGRKEILQPESGMLRCKNCTDEMDRLFDDIRRGATDTSLQYRYNMHAIFSLHSKRGSRCPDCSRFIPGSSFSDNGVSCPYDDCIFIGQESELKACSHPMVTFGDKRQQSIGKVPTHSSSKDGMLVSAFADMSVSADAYIDVKSRFEHEYKVLVSVIAEQLDRVKRTNSPSTIVQKTLMYEAYQEMLEEHTVEIISYLVHQQQKSDFPIQARIFQKYVELVEMNMPFTITKGKKEIDIVSLTDPELSLFNGISEFDATVRNNNTIPNKTKEEYIGGRSFKNYGPCFIGRIIDVAYKESGASLRDKVVEHSFSQILMDKSVEPGTEVTVTHFRILSHYEMDSLVHLQRIRRSIVDSVYYRLNNKKRVAGSKE